MNLKPANGSDAYSLAHDGLTHVTSSAQAQFVEQRREIQERNRPKVAVLEMTIDYLMKKHTALIEQIEPMLSQVVSPKTSFLSLIGALCFLLVGFVLSRKTLEPFNLGLSGEVFSIGLTLLFPYAVDRIIRRFSLQRYVHLMLDIILFASAIATMIAFAGIRADVFRHDITGGPAVVLDTFGSSIPDPDNSSDQVADTLRWAWVSAAIGFELACGLCWHDFAESRRGKNFNLLRSLEKELFRVRVQYLAALTELQGLLLEPARTYATNLANFRRGLLDAMSKLDNAAGRSGRAAALVLVGLFVAHTAFGANSVHLVAEIDLSTTEKITGFVTKSQFDDNMQAVPQLFATLPAGVRVNIIGITDQTLASPFLILSAKLSADEGYFGSRLARGRRDLVSEWLKRTRDLKPIAQHTDVIGGFIYASELFTHSNASRKALVIFSDMRHEQPGVLDLETPDTINVAKAMKIVEAQGLIAPLSGVEIYIFGAGSHSSKKHPDYLQSLKAFYIEYLRRSGGILKRFSTGREVEGLAEVTALPEQNVSRTR